MNEQRDPNYPVSHVREVHVIVGNDFNLLFSPGKVVRVRHVGWKYRDKLNPYVLFVLDQ